MKLNKFIIQNSKDKLIDFSNCELSTKNYEESSMKKNAIIYNGEKYLLKYMEKNKAKHYQNLKNNKETYFNSVYSEYISCHIGKMIGLDIQDTIIGYEKENNKFRGIEYIPCVACKDFCKSGENIVDFERIFQIISRKERKTYNRQNFYDILEIIEKQEFVDKNKLKENFLDMFVFDSFIGNFDRNLKNFGIIENEKDKTYRIAPIFDCASSLHPKASRRWIKMIEKSFDNDIREKNIKEQALEKPNSYFKDENGIKINYSEFFKNKEFDQNIDIAKSFIKIAPKLIEINNRGEIDKLLDSFKGIVIPERIKVITEELNFKIKEVFIPTLDIAKIVLNREINEVIDKDYKEFEKYNKEEKKEFLLKIKNTLRIQELLVENNFNIFDTKEIYQEINNFLKNTKNKDMKSVFNYLKNNGFPSDYIEHFEEKFKEEINKTKKIDKSKESEIIDENEIIDDIDKKSKDEREI